MVEKTTRDQILRVAEELFATKGYDKATMREIAERLGIKKPSLYHHFLSKEELYNTLIVDIYRQVLDELISTLSEGDTVEEKVRASLDRMIDLWAKHPNYPTIIASEIILGDRSIFSELINEVGQQQFNEVIGKWREALSKEDSYRDFNIPMVVLIAFGIPINYFFSSQYLSSFLGKDSLSPEMLDNFKRELSNLFLYGLRKTDT